MEKVPSLAECVQKLVAEHIQWNKEGQDKHFDLTMRAFRGKDGHHIVRISVNDRPIDIPAEAEALLARLAFDENVIAHLSQGGQGQNF